MTSAAWRRFERRSLLETPRLSVVRDLVQHPGGGRIAYDHVSVSELVRVVVIDEGAFVLIRQHHYLADSTLLQCPGGAVDAGEAPADAAARELEEETGYNAERLTPLVSLWPMPGLTASRTHCYLAEELTVSGRLQLDETEADVELVRLPLDEVVAAITDGRIGCAPSAAAVLLAAHRLN